MYLLSQLFYLSGFATPMNVASSTTSLFSPPTVALTGSENSTIGPWKLESVLGQGRWTVVYRASPIEAPSAGQGDYALKIVRESGGIGESLLRREAAAGSSVSHPHLVPVLASRTKQPPSYLVMPYLPGSTLRQLMQAAPRRLDLRFTIWSMRQVAEALRALHDAGWLHGDVKPENIMTGPSGHATLIDLGFVRGLDVTDEDARALLGSPAYAAPERMSCDPSYDEASDVFGLGVTCYELLTGELPWQTRGEVSTEPQDPAMSLREARSDCPTELARLIGAMMAETPGDRPSLEVCIDEWTGWELEWLTTELAG